MNPVSILIQSTLCFGVAALALLVFRRSPQARVCICRAAMVTFIASVVATPWLTSPFRSVQPNAPEAAAPVAKFEKTISQSGSSLSVAHEDASPSIGSSSAAEPIAPKPFEVDWAKSAAVLYLIGLGLGLLFLAVGYGRLAFILVRSRPIIDLQLIQQVQEFSSRMGIRVPKVRSGEDVSGPMVAGVIRPVLLLPADYADLDLSAVMAHELCHLKHRDLAWLQLSRFVRVVLWCQPLAWILDRAHRNSAEERCDSAVLDSGVAPETYAGLLVALKSAQLAKASLPAIGIASRGSNFGHRIREILEPNWKRFSPRSRVASLACLALVGCLSALMFAQPMTKKTQIIDAVDEAGNPVALEWAQGNLCTSLRSRIEAVNFTVKGSRFEVPSNMLGKGTVVVYCQSTYGRVDVAYLLANQPASKFIFHRTGTVRGKVSLPAPNDGSAKVRLSFLIRDSRDSEGSSIGWIGMPEFAKSKTVAVDRSGNFEMSGVPLGSQIGLDIDDERLCKDKQSQSIRLERNGKSQSVAISFGWAGSIEGRLVDGEKPVVGALVGAQSIHNSSSSFAITDENGRYRIAKLKPEAYIVATDEATVSAPVRARQNVVVKAKAVVPNVDLKTEVGGMIAGRIVKTDGTPEAGATIGVYGPAHPESGAWVASTKADSSGHFSMRVPTGANYVYSMMSGKDGQRVQVSEHATTKVTLQTPTDIYSKSPFEFLFSDSHAIAVNISETRFLGSDQPTHVVLGGLADINPSNPVVWSPNGAKVAMTPEFTKSIQAWLKRFGKFGYGTYALVRMTDLPCDQDRFIYSWGVGRGSGDFRGYKKSATILVPMGKTEELGTLDLKIGIPAELPKTVFKGKADKLMRPMKQVPGMPHYQMRLGTYAKDKDWSLTMDLEDGRAFHAVGYGDNETVVIGMTPKDKLRNVTVTARKVGWATFKNVALRPGSL